jgi:hypothetical protein
MTCALNTIASPGWTRADGQTSSEMRMSDCRRGRGGGLRVNSSEHHHALGINTDPLTRAGLDHPGQLHDRPTRGVEDQALDILGVALDAVPLTSDDRYLRRRAHSSIEPTRSS